MSCDDIMFHKDDLGHCFMGGGDKAIFYLPVPPKKMLIVHNIKMYLCFILSL